MTFTSRLLSAVVVASMAVAVPACADTSPTNDRWVTTEDTAVALDWDAVGEVYKDAEGPEDLERRVNEIYDGDEIISVAVRDVDAQTQEVIGFFDRNEDGKVADPEKVFTIDRVIEGEGEGHYQIHGHGAYYGYHSPMFSIAAGMLMGSMLSRAFSPGYVPMYTRPYVTAPARRGELVAHRSAYRKANPSKARSGQRSRSGRAYNRRGGGFGGGKTFEHPTAHAWVPPWWRSVRADAVGVASRRGGGGLPMKTAKDLPFDRKPALELLGLDDPERTTVDEDFCSSGWGVVPEVVLAGSDGQRTTIEQPLVLALHTPDDAEPGPLELEFWLEEDGEELALRISWDAFARKRVQPLLRPEHTDVVLALCNPDGRPIRRPAWLGDRRLHWAEGDVTSWLDVDGSIRLSARCWRVA